MEHYVWIKLCSCRWQKSFLRSPDYSFLRFRWGGGQAQRRILLRLLKAGT